jgi:hypothetical protein
MLFVPQRSIQAGPRSVVREITDFYYRKGGRGIAGIVSARWNGGSLCRKKKKKGRIFMLDHFYNNLNLEVGRKFVSFPVSNGFQTRGRIRVDSCVHFC